jgi:hypothetical protein
MDTKSNFLESYMVKEFLPTILIIPAIPIPQNLPLLHLKIGFYNGEKDAGDIFLLKV